MKYPPEYNAELKAFECDLADVELFKKHLQSIGILTHARTDAAVSDGENPRVFVEPQVEITEEQAKEGVQSFLKANPKLKYDPQLPDSGKAIIAESLKSLSQKKKNA